MNERKEKTGRKTKNASESTMVLSTRINRSKQTVNNVASGEANIEEISRITRSGSSILRLKKKFEDIERKEQFDTDPNSIECIMGCGRRKCTILLPCRHQHTCETCWYMWKIHQINKISYDQLNDAGHDDDDILKPKCPMCKESVEEAISAFN